MEAAHFLSGINGKDFLVWLPRYFFYLCILAVPYFGHNPSNMTADQLFDQHDKYKERTLSDRFFKHRDIEKIIKSLGQQLKLHITQAGLSKEGRAIHLIRFGHGETKVFLWSQMHGDEPTATMALFDLINFLIANDEFNGSRDKLAANCTLYLMPMVNPDGAERYTRRNAQYIDINRDFTAQRSPEAIILRQTRDAIKPDIGFNLHDQSTLWSAGDSNNPATISLLAPAYNHELSLNPIRTRAMHIIANIYDQINHDIPKHIARFDDEFEPRAFGDNFQKEGTSTILIEAGGYPNDPEKQFIRKIYFKAIMAGLISISGKQYLGASTHQYFAIPPNTKTLFHYLLKNCSVKGTRVDIGINYEEIPTANKKGTTKIFKINDIGDLRGKGAYTEIDASNMTIDFTDLKLNTPLTLDLKTGESTTLSFKKGLLI